MRRQAAQRLGALVAFGHGPGPELARAVGVLGQRRPGRGWPQRSGAESASRALSWRSRSWAAARSRRSAASTSLSRASYSLRAGQNTARTCFSAGRILQRFLKLGDLLELLAIHQRRQRIAQLLVRQPRHRDQKGQQQDDVLRHLRPGDGTHPPRNEHSSTPPKPSRMPISNCTPVRREAINPTP
jgi:hypothetical protein